MNFIDDGTYEVEYEYTNRTILGGNVMNIFLFVAKADGW